MRYLIREKFFRITEDSTIKDESGQPIFDVNGRLFSLHNTIVMSDMAGNELATIRRRLISIVPTYEITSHGQELAEVRKHLFTPFIDRFTIDIPGPDDLEIQGSLFEHEFTIAQRSGGVVATVSKRWFSVTDTYAVDIAPGQNDALILASVLALDLAEDAERADHG